MKSDKDLADHLDAQDRLRSRGYKWKKCDHCKGIGFIIVSRINQNEFAATHRCVPCDGRGGTWEPPITC